MKNMSLKQKYHMKKGENRMNTKLNPGSFSHFLRCLSLVRYNSAAVDIRGGVLRQRTSGKICIFQMDLRPLISTIDICIDDVHRKLRKLTKLSKQKVSITVSNNKILFSSRWHTSKFNTHGIDPSNNKFITAKEFSDLYTLKEQDLVLEHVLTKNISKLMREVYNKGNVFSFEILFTGDNASITADAIFGKKTYTLKYGIPIKRHSKGVLTLDVSPFLIDHDGDVLFQMYNTQENVYIGKFTTSIGKITINVYCKALLREYESEVRP